ncbi:DNA-binding response regulator [Pullulanibacillus camelliae]|uniref:DNA-binding response regulator n=1 Tax=Pullulanibacillus camelliae TaxID=1707096 RepID=A0A8J2VS57_9BACL|nr:response regulator transcription factor [Pullulanibacillus camelliae]GGE36997.1 DNA-binding response regulator [Pullulanibacillus camelliae]
MSGRIRVIVADDHAIVRSGVKRLLNAEANIEVVAEASDGNEAITKTLQENPDIVIMDISMPAGMSGLEATQTIKEAMPNVNVLILTMHDEPEYLFRLLKLGASGYILKSALDSELIAAVYAVSEGQVYLYPTAAKHLVEGFLHPLANGEEHEAYRQLSEREKEIFILIAKGFSNKEIAEQLFISVKTVETHKRNIMEKLSLTKRHEVVEFALSRGLLQ